MNLLPEKSSISTQRIVILEGVPRCLEIEGVIVKIVFERKSVLVCRTGCRVTPNQYKIRYVLSFTAFYFIFSFVFVSMIISVSVYCTHLCLN